MRPSRTPRAAGEPAARRRRFAGERGEVSTQMVLLVPALMLLVLLVVQGALYFHAANVATAAAERGASAGAIYLAPAGAAASEARHVVSDNGAQLQGVSASQGETVLVTVRVRVSQVVPFFPGSVSRTAQQPKERFVPEADR
jgi:Flp pilus assembly protein TadG